jgi:hypothetical protein
MPLLQQGKEKVPEDQVHPLPLTIEQYASVESSYI